MSVIRVWGGGGGVWVCFGVLGFYSKRAERFIMPMLDIFQTVPTFAYLLPILLLFGFGTVVGLIGSVVYSFPPMVRNTIVGLRAVSSEVIEAGSSSGAIVAPPVTLPASSSSEPIAPPETPAASSSSEPVVALPPPPVHPAQPLDRAKRKVGILLIC